MVVKSDVSEPSHKLLVSRILATPISSVIRSSLSLTFEFQLLSKPPEMLFLQL
jgi:hypothetical protein